MDSSAGRGAQTDACGQQPPQAAATAVGAGRQQAAAEEGPKPPANRTATVAIATRLFRVLIPIPRNRVAPSLVPD